MKTPVYFLLAIVFVVFSSNAYRIADDKFVGVWKLEERVVDPDKLIDKGEMLMSFEKVNNEYYRATSLDDHMLLKVVNDSTLFCGVIPGREVTVLWKTTNKLQITVVAVDGAGDRPSITLWSKTDKK